LEWLTVAWMAVEAGVAIASGVAAHCISLVAVGLDSVIELASAGVLIWRLSNELRFGREVSEKAEWIARRIASGLLFVLAAYVVTAAGWSLWRGEGGTFSWPGLTVAV
jgi:hypothetical protein